MTIRHPELAVLGGAPTFTEALHVGRPNVLDQDAFLDRVRGALDRKWLTAFGPLVAEFEQRLADLAGVAHCVATCNASVAMQVLLRSAGLTGEVVMPSFTFIATAHTALWEGLVPVFADIDERTGNIDPEHARRLVTDRTAAIVAVHLWGHPAPVEQLTELAAEHDVPLLFDSAHAIGSQHHGRPVGGFGSAEVFSFHATKFVNAFEGGAVLTDDGDLADRVRRVHNYGRGKGEDVAYLGTNAKMTEVCAAMGLTSLENMSELIAVNIARHERYRAGLRDVPGLTLREPRPFDSVNHQYIVVEVDQDVAGVSRDELAAALRAENVLVRTHFHPGCHRTEPYVRDPAKHTPLPLPRSEALGERVISLPTGTGVRPEQVDQLCELIGRIARQGDRVSSAVTPS
ncbi:dTDP-4-dehydro-6-deoxyglucose aminotransferase [Amycolatopsis antarctica]|uniref:dTDP-4-dehydro-6-deoxyglucose aminotransferase n=1 Tax=Amycolatopsis antarctica TaxID=1854586 RepID=A0A263D9D4_9PSEU|nr:DegT/DnrJ/EryC1/StrS family aminotransferase [Amycolatopsis antarctica]OZM74157.1 dTDP-4-dehydro-6-deoxyglucose aminotransferase [Amycolatopsis antarctica]